MVATKKGRKQQNSSNTPVKGDKVRARYQGGTKEYVGVVRTINKNGTIAIDYEDGDKEEQAKIEWVTEILANKLRKGDKVMAFHRGDRRNQEYPGVVKAINADGTVNVAYDDGDVDNAISAALVRRIHEKVSKKKQDRSKGKRLSVGARVMCHFRGDPNGQEYPGTISKMNKELNTINVDYDDGDKDKDIHISAARPIDDGDDEEEEEEEEEEEGGGGGRKKRSSSDNESGDDDDDEEEEEEEEEDDKSKSESESGSESGSEAESTAELELINQLRKRTESKIQVGSLIKARYKQGKDWFAGTVVKINKDSTMNIDYEDGDKEKSVSKKNVKLDSSKQCSLKRLENLFKEIQLEGKPGRLSADDLQRVLWDELQIRVTRKDMAKLSKTFGVKGTKGIVSYKAILNKISPREASKSPTKQGRRSKEARGKGFSTETLSGLPIGKIDQLSKTLVPKHHKKLLGKYMSSSQFEEFVTQDLKCKKLNPQEVEAILHCFDSKGDGKLDGTSFLLFVKAHKINVMDVNVADILDTIRRKMFPQKNAKNTESDDSDDEEEEDDDDDDDDDRNNRGNNLAKKQQVLFQKGMKLLKDIRKAFLKQDQQKSGIIEGKRAKVALSEACSFLTKKQIELIVKSNYFTPPRRDTEDSSEDEEENSDEDNTKDNTRRLSFFKKSSSSAAIVKFHYETFLLCISSPELSHPAILSKLQSPLLMGQRNEKDLVAKIAAFGKKGIAEFYQHVIYKVGIPIIPEEILRLVIKSGGKIDSKEFKVNGKVVAAWIEKKGFYSNPNNSKNVAKATKLVVKSLGLKRSQKRKRLDRREFSNILNFRNDPGSDSEEEKHDDSGSGDDSRGHSRTAFLEFVEPKCPQISLVRAYLEKIDPENTGFLDEHAAFKLCATSLDKERGNHSDSDQDDESEDGSGESESKFDGQDDGDCDDVEGAERADSRSALLSCESIYKTIKALGKNTVENTIKQAFKDKNEVSSANSSDEEESDMDDEEEDRQIEILVKAQTFRRVALKSWKLSSTDCLIISSAFGVKKDSVTLVDISSFATFVMGHKLPSFSGLKGEALSGLENLRVASANQYDKVSCMLLSNELTLKSKVRKVLEMKAPKMATKKDINNIIATQDGDPERVINFLSKKFKIKLPAKLDTDLRKLDPKNEGKADGKKALALICKLLGTKLSKSESMRIISHFQVKKSANLIWYKELILMIKPFSDGNVRLINKMMEIGKLCKKFGIHDFKEKALAKNHNRIALTKLLNVISTAGIPLTNTEISRLAFIGDRTGKLSKLSVKKMFQGKSAANYDSGDSDSSSSESDSNSAKSSGQEDDSDSSSEEEEDDDDDDDKKENASSSKSRWFINKLRGPKKSDEADDDEDSSSSDESDSEDGNELNTRKGWPKSGLISRKTKSKLKDQAEKLKVALKKVDKSSTGSINSNSFAKTLSKIGGCSTEESNKLIKILDVKAESSIEYRCFLGSLIEPLSSENRLFMVELVLRLQKNLRGKNQKTLKKDLLRADKSRVSTVKDALFFGALKRAGAANLKKKEKQVLERVFGNSVSEGSIDYNAFLDVVFCSKEVLRSLSIKLRHWLKLYHKQEKRLEISGSMPTETFFKLWSKMGLPAEERDLLLVCLCLQDQEEDLIDCGILASMCKGKGSLRFVHQKGSSSEGDTDDESEDSASVGSPLSSIADSEEEEMESHVKRKNWKKMARKKQPNDSGSEFSSGGSSDDDDDSEKESNDEDSESDSGSDFDDSSESDNSKSGDSDSEEEDDDDDLSSDASDDTWGSSSKSSKHKAKKKKSRAPARRKKVLQLDDDEEYYHRIEKALKKAFDILDVDRNGLLSAAEFSRVMLSLNRECSHEEIEAVIKRGDTDSDGQLSRREFVKIMIKMIRQQSGKLFPSREAEIRNTFQRMDLNGDGTISKKEFEIAVTKLVDKRLKRSQINALMKLADRDRDGTISYEEFMELVTLVAKSRNTAIRKGIDKKTLGLLEKIIRGPVPDPSQYLRLFSRMPKHFRPGMMKELDSTQDHSIASALNTSSAKDVVDITNLSQSKRELKKQNAQEPTLTYQVQMRSAGGIPVISDQKMIDSIVERRARVCLWRRSDVEEDKLESESESSSDNDSSDDDDESNMQQSSSKQGVSNRSPFVGNPYSVKATWDSQQEDVWRFRKRNLSTFVVRISERLRDQAISRGEHLCLLVELTILVQTNRKDKKAPPVEMGCGWCAIDLDQLEQASIDGRDIRVDVFGGSPKVPTAINDQDILARRFGWRALRRSFSNATVRPKLKVRCQGIGRTSKAFLKAISLLPQTIISAHASLPLISLYHSICARQSDLALQNGISRSATSGDRVKFEPVLSIFPHILQDAQLLVLLTKKWQKMNGQGIRDEEKRIAAFSKLVLSFWPLLCTTDRPVTSSASFSGGLENSSANTMSPSALRFRKKYNPTGDMFFFGSPDDAPRHFQSRRHRRSSWMSLGDGSDNDDDDDDNDERNKGRKSGSLLFKPFNIRETLV